MHMPARTSHVSGERVGPQANTHCHARVGHAQGGCMHVSSKRPICLYQWLPCDVIGFTVLLIGSARGPPTGQPGWRRFDKGRFGLNRADSLISVSQLDGRFTHLAHLDPSGSGHGLGSVQIHCYPMRSGHASSWVKWGPNAILTVLELIGLISGLAIKSTASTDTKSD